MHMFDGIDKDNFVIVNIWTSEANKAMPGANVGHVSIQTKNNYISLWPGRRIEKNKELTFLEKYYFRYFGERPPSFKMNYEEDCALEALSEDRGRIINKINECLTGEVPYVVNMSNGKADIIYEQPSALEKNCYIMAVRPINANVRIVVYRLRLDRIESEFNSLNPKAWRLIGSNLLTRLIDEKSPENCSSLAYRLLKAGGLYLKVDELSSSDNSSIVTPDDLVKHIILYKEKELALAPETSKLYKSVCPDESNVEELRKAYIDKKEKLGSGFNNLFGKS